MATSPFISLGASADGQAVGLTLNKLLHSRMLVQATSGAGKSWLLRRLIENAGPHVQTLVLDVEGEFSTLRSCLDVALIGSVAHGADVAVNVNSAATLGRRLIERRVSAVIDLSELDRQPRAEYVRLFLGALLGIPKNLYRPVLVVIDEAHQLCPEQGDSVAKQAVIGLMDRGRKRGLCGVLASQRLSKLDKDAAAEAANVAVGRTSPIDLKRASDLLGMSVNDSRSFVHLDDGMWGAIGPAVVGPRNADGVCLFKSGGVKSQHPQAGSKYAGAIPAPSAAIGKIIPELAAEEKAGGKPLTLEDATRQLQEKQKQAAALERRVQALESRPAVPVVDTRKADEAHWRAMRERDTAWKTWTETVQRNFKRLTPTLAELDKVLHAPPPALEVTAIAPVTAMSTSVPPSILRRQVLIFPLQPAPAPKPVAVDDATGDEVLQKVGRALLNVMANMHQRGQSPLSKGQLVTLAGYKASGDTAAAFAQFSQQGWMGDDLNITAAGLARLGDFTPLPRGEKLRETWLRKLEKCDAKILSVMFDHYPKAMTKAEIVELSGYKASGDTAAAFSRFNTSGWLVEDGKKKFRITDDFFEE